MVGSRYKMGDYTPYLYHTTDYGATWKLITNGIPEEHFTRVLRADKNVEGLLYCGTEFGLYISTNNGASWKPFQLNLPEVPITDLALKDNDLIVATQGRSFWLLDDLNVIWDEIRKSTSEDKMRLYSVRPTVGFGRGGNASNLHGTNNPGGVPIFFHLPSDEEKVTLKFIDDEGDVIRTYSTKAKEKGDKLEVEKGLNRFDWDTRYEKADDFEGMLIWWGTLAGPKAPPGNYTARLIVGEDSLDTPFEILPDPRMEGTVEDRQAQFEFLLEIRNKLDETHDAIRNMRQIKKQISALNSRLDSATHKALIDEGKRMDSTMTAIEKVLYQTKLKSNQDMLNFPIMLNNKLAHVASLASMGIYAPTKQMRGVANDVTQRIDEQLEKWYALRDDDLKKYNAMIREQEVDFIGVEE